MGYKKNRKKQMGTPILPWRWAGVLLTLGLTAFVYLWLMGQCDALGRQIKQLEDQRTEIRKRVLSEEYRLANMKTPENINRLLQQLGIQMGLPDPGQVVVVSAHGGARPVQVAAGSRATGVALRPMIHD